MGKECGAWLSRRLWGGSNTSPIKTTAWEATLKDVNFDFRCVFNGHNPNASLKSTL